MKNWLQCYNQNFVTNGAESSRQPVAGGVPQALAVGSMSFNVFSSEQENGMECPLSKDVHGPKLGAAVNTLEEGAALQRDLDRLEKWVEQNLIQFSKSKYGILHL